MPLVRTLMVLAAGLVVGMWSVAAIHRFGGDLCFVGRCTTTDLWVPAGLIAWRGPLAVAVLLTGSLGLTRLRDRATKP